MNLHFFQLVGHEISHTAVNPLQCIYIHQSFKTFSTILSRHPFRTRTAGSNGACSADHAEVPYPSRSRSAWILSRPSRSRLLVR